MRLPRRTPLLPEAAREALDLGQREKVLAAARIPDGSWVAATAIGLVGVGWRVDWAWVTHAKWYDETERLSFTWLDPSGALHEREFELAEPGRLPETVHERVVATIVFSRRVSVGDRRGVRVVARRQPKSQEVFWQVVPDAGVDVSAPEVRAQVDATKRAIADELGL
jgi:hypothetical protein